MGKFRVSADIGGTFTDFVFYNTETGQYKAWKTLTTSENLSNAIISGISEEMEDFNEIDFFVHGTTSGLNAVLERRGVKVALITTKGFKDVYEIARGNRTSMYNIRYRKPKPLIDRSDVYEIDERISYNGTIEKEVDENQVKKIAEDLKSKNYDSVAVCLINAYNNPKHEQIVGKILQSSLSDVPISLSHIIAREWREYERTSTVVMNSYISPIVQKYLKSLEKRMIDKGFNEKVYVMQSGGGIITSEIAKEEPIQTLLSGPVGGAIGNQYLSEKLGYKNLIGIDMGGTSYDVSLVVDGKPDVSTETELEGFPILTPMVNIFTIGAGGGSIAWIQGGGLRVGPLSAGSNPGPACYGKGGENPTITDANVVLGRIDPIGFLGGNMDLDKKAAENSMKKLSDELNISVKETAEGICNVADAKMAGAIREITVRKGLDPREFVMAAYGGAGPMHACLTADELGIETILVPLMPGTFSAWGMHQSDIRQDSVRTFKCVVEDVPIDEINDKYDEMEKEIEKILKQQNIFEDKSKYIKSADLRYQGQDMTLNVVFSDTNLTKESIKKLRENFDKLHMSVYGHNNTNSNVEVVNVRLTGIGLLDRTEAEQKQKKSKKSVDPIKTQKVIFYGEEYETKYYNREDFESGHKFTGPAVVEELTTTSVIPPGFKFEIDEFLNIIIKKIK